MPKIRAHGSITITKEGAGWGRKGLAGTGAAEKGTESRAGAQTSQAGNRLRPDHRMGYGEGNGTLQVRATV